MGFGRYRFRRSFGQVKAQFRGARPKFYPLFTGLLDTYAGAAAAYSLRRLSKIASSVVRVRRASDNAEKDFTADNITDGAMVNWVNGQIVPPLDIRELDANGERTGALVEAAAAYSLRNLSSSFTGSVVEVRRSSDGEEDSFTASDVADGTLEDWVSEDTTQYMQFDGVNDDISTSALLPATDDFTLTIEFIPNEVPASTTGLYGSLNSGDSGRHVFQINTSGQAFAFIAGVSVLTTANSINVGAINTFVLSKSGTNWSLSLNGGTADTATGSATLDTAGSNIGDPYSGMNFKGIITSLSVGAITWDGSITDATSNGWTVNGTPTSSLLNDGFVSKWYDQSGNANHATQGTDAKQPKIVDAGSLVSGGINFDGVNDTLDLPAVISSINSASSFTVARTTNASATQSASALSRNAPELARFYAPIATSGNFYFGYGANTTAINLGSSDTDEHLFTGIAGSSTAEGFIDGTSGGTVSSVDLYSQQASGGIGSINSTTHWNGTISEIILYSSDQSDNRTAIEANIGETYGIDLPSGVDTGYDQVDGFVETWYDQSGNGNDAVQQVSGSQPKIVDAGSLVTGGLDFDGSNDGLSVSGQVLTSSSFYATSVMQHATGVSTASGQNVFGQYQISASGRFQLSANNSSDYSFFANATDSISGFGTGAIGTSQTLISVNADGSNAEIWRDGTSKATDTYSGFTPATVDFTIGNDSDGEREFNGKIAEIIVYPSDQSANRAAIETNINDHYDIYA
jgi:hypothetical protein